MEKQELEKIAAAILRECRKAKICTLEKIDDTAQKAAAIMVESAKPFNLEPNAEKILEKFCYQCFVDRTTRDFDENNIKKIWLLFDKLLEEYPCANNTKIEQFCRYTAHAFSSMSYVGEMAELTNLLDA